MPSNLILNTDLGEISLRLLPEAAPRTVDQVTKIVNSKLYDGTGFYRSDFVIQFGLHGTGRSYPDLDLNETRHGEFITNARGTASIAHFDVPDCGGTEIFINLNDNPHLDSAYGGYCVFARVEDPRSFQTVDAIATAVKQRGSVGISSAIIR